MAESDSSRPQDDTEVSLEDLVAEALERIEADGPSALDELCRRHPEQASALASRVGWLLEGGFTAVTPSAVPEELGGFRLLEPLGQGGMGIVYRARDTELGRDVALKLVRPEQLYFPGARERFEREVTVVAGLAHPGIVPVHSVGERDGVPYFAMELVRGATLGDVIAHLRASGTAPSRLSGSALQEALAELAPDGDDGPSPLFEGPWPVVVARIVREVAEALEHAHRRGVLHRDVKPSNVMITRGGRVLLMDFGLSSAASASRLTRTGLRVGSLAYMAPEQLTADVELDRRVDVWSLGITLYELLALDLPFDVSSEASLHESQRRGPPTDLRQRNPSVGWELDTIVQTALEVDRTRRYASAADLARDLECALTGRPIQARRASTVRRLRRWARRHPGTSVAASLGFLFLTVGPSVFGWQQMRANERVAAEGRKVTAANEALEAALLDVAEQRDEARAERERAERNFARAERNFERATRAVEQMLARVGDEDLRDVPRMEGVRRELLLDALSFFDELVEDAESQSGLWLPLARTLHRAADIHGYLYDHEAAVTMLTREREALRAALAEPGDAQVEAEARVRLIDNHVLRAHALELCERHAEAESDLRWALDELASERLAGWAERRGQRASAELQLGKVLEASGRSAEAEATWRSTYERLRAEDELGADVGELAAVAHELGSALSRRGRPDALAEAEELLQEAARLRAPLHAAQPADAGLAHHAMESWINLAFVQMSLGHVTECRRSCEAATALGERLVVDHPGVTLYQLDHGAALVNRAMIAMATDEPDGGERWFARAVTTLRPVIEARPADEGLQSFLLALYNLADAHAERGELEAARTLTAEVIASADRAAAARALTPAEELPLQYALALHARSAIERSDHVDAARHARRALGRAASPAELGELVFVLVRCARAAEADPALTGDARGELARQYAAEAADAFVRAAHAGSSVPPMLAAIDSDGRRRLSAVPAFRRVLEDLGLADD